MSVQLDNDEISTILAALRFYQQNGLGDPANRPLDIHDIATNGEQETSLDDDGIDRLCEKLNVSEELTDSCKEDWSFERSSGYAGYRNAKTGDWIYESQYNKRFARP